MLSSGSPGKPTMKLKMAPTSWRAHISAAVIDLLELHVLLQPIEHLLRAGLDADHHAAQARRTHFANSGSPIRQA